MKDIFNNILSLQNISRRCWEKQPPLALSIPCVLVGVPSVEGSELGHFPGLWLLWQT